MLEEAKLVEEDIDAKAPKRSWNTSIKIAGELYATSLFWQPLQNKEDPFLEVQEAAEGILEGADLFCTKPGKAPQFGICVSGEGYKSGELSAAVSLATAMNDKSSFVAVFKTVEGWWYTCIRNDIILSDGDMLFTDEQEAKSQFMSMLAVPDWGRKIAPPEWNIEETEYPDLEELIKRGLRSKLQKIKALRGTKLLVVVGISAVVGFWLLSSIINAIFLTPTKRPIIAPVPPKSMEPVEEIPEVKPWEELLDSTAIMLECFEKVQNLAGIMPPGWSMGRIGCTQNTASTSWQRQIGRMTWASKALDESGLKFATRYFTDDGNGMVASLNFGEVRKVSSPPMYSQNDLLDLLNDLFQAMGQPVSFTKGSVTSPRQNIYRHVGFKFTSNHDPITWNKLLTKFSGLQIKMINYNIESKTWDYEGVIYAL